MGLWDVVGNVLTGGAYGAVTTAIDVATGAATKDTSIPPPDATIPAPVMDGLRLGGLIGRAVPSAPRQVTCCDRYRFNDGFLVDGATGLAWRYDERQKAFIEVSRKPAEEKLPLIRAIWDAEIQTVRKEYEAQLVNTFSPEHREAAIKEFEKRFVKPIRDVAGVS
jgi:hypothetical protein